MAPASTSNFQVPVINKPTQITLERQLWNLQFSDLEDDTEFWVNTSSHCTYMDTLNMNKDNCN